MMELTNVSRTFVVREGLRRKTVHAVTDASIVVAPGETLAVVGESGCGKSTLARIVAGLIPPTAGQVRWDGEPLDPRSAADVRRWRRAAQLVHQDPYAALNPVRRIGDILAEPLLALGIVPRGGVMPRIRELLRQVGLDPDMVAGAYPHQLSGGQRQRVLVARALTVEPQVLVADEAVSMVDVSQRLGILQLFQGIMRDRGVGLVFITHDLRVARYIAGPGHMVVMYLGRVIEAGATEAILHHPGHPYTQCLVTAVPLLRGRETARLDPVEPKSYDVPDAVDLPPGCAFAPRCPYAIDRCLTDRPELRPVPSHPERQIACHLAEQFVPVEAPQGA
jgi:peptide/nickel transport system ATP-binding protein